jgi:hypothetical protein
MLKRVLEATTVCAQTCSIPRELIKKLKCMPRDCLCCAPDDDFEVALCVNCYGGRRSNFHTDSNHRASDRVNGQSTKDI